MGDAEPHASIGHPAGDEQPIEGTGLDRSPRDDHGCGCTQKTTHHPGAALTAATAVGLKVLMAEPKISA